MKITTRHYPLLFTVYWATAAIVCGQPIIVAHFEGDYGDTQNSALRNVVQTSTGDYNGDGNATDSRAFLPIAVGVPKLAEFNPGQAARNNLVFGGGQMVNFNSATPAPAFGLIRYNGSGKYYQVTNAAGSAANGLAFAMFVPKEHFLAGAQTANLKFANKADGFIGKVGFAGISLVDEGGIRRARLLVRSGTQWYVSRSTWGSRESFIEVNPYAETWHLYDPAVRMFVYEVSAAQTIPDTASVAGSTLDDIQAVGVLLQNTLFDGRTANAVWLQFFSFRVELDPNPAPLHGGWVVDPVLGWLYDFQDGWTSWIMDGSADNLGRFHDAHRDTNGVGWIWHESRGWIYLLAGSVTGTGTYGYSVELGWVYIASELGNSFLVIDTGVLTPWM
jgi:hypothetical protein